MSCFCFIPLTVKMASHWSPLYLGRHFRRKEEETEETEIYTAGSICHRGYSGHHSCHCWVNKLGKMIFLLVKNDPNNAGEWIFFAWVIAEWFCPVCLCVHTEATETHTFTPTRQVSESSRLHGKRYNDRERRASILVLPGAGEINGCIQDFYTPLIGFTGH